MIGPTPVSLCGRRDSSRGLVAVLPHEGLAAVCMYVDYIQT